MRNCNTLGISKMHKEPDAKPTLPDCDIYNSSLFVPKSTEVVRIAVGNLHAGVPQCLR